MELHMEILMVYLLECHKGVMMELYRDIRLETKMAPIMGINMAAVMLLLVEKYIFFRSALVIWVVELDPLKYI